MYLYEITTFVIYKKFDFISLNFNSLLSYCEIINIYGTILYASPRSTLVFSGWQFPMLPSRAVNIYIMMPKDKSLFYQIGVSSKKDRKRPRNQSNSKSWFKHRYWSLTSYRFGDIAKFTRRHIVIMLCDNLTTKRKLSALDLTLETVWRQGHQKIWIDYQLQKCWLFVNPAYPFLGAKSDGVFNNKTLLEIKCPYKWRKSLIKLGALVSFLEYENNVIVSNIHFTEHIKN